ASCGNDNKVRLWNAASLEESAVLTGHGKKVSSVGFAPNGTLASGSLGGSICLWDIEHPKTEAVMPPTGAGVLAPAFSLDGRTPASAHDDRTVLLWNPQDKQPRALHILKERGSSVVSLALSSDGKILACRTNNGNVELWDLSQGKPKKVALLKGKRGGR